ncbi:Cell division protein ftsA [Pseudomonas ficuserectae]|uniref:Cell division protein FtsA n=38 Tax=Gammaproteobacteria TaxID=1236 RepID=A0AAX1VUP9_PSEAJ|nr:Cell division protein ftsA [Pseudomonas syringae pv. castaneae]KPX21633.1 Cell division protein ftsA [Pseudomonas amygdali pv. dendropanacis]KPX49219.1 Cell division protein ftsA [Pseudomonas savastanoi pv. glycinea]KPX97993.1 Cell division protein ftsA [Pseudomonas amygdali pv. myricae]KPY01870.1 Cell division protein ftsA [Pseudomonas savastanoi pv. nerii]KPZ14666.1 Cell division protein ftsA [Pseudomonas amygdali pv. ulmi]RML81075.1 Cell division protein ftsA [Pseudomonas amygdali pv. t
MVAWTRPPRRKNAPFHRDLRQNAERTNHEYRARRLALLQRPCGRLARTGSGNDGQTRRREELIRGRTMANVQSGKMIVGLDIGTSKVVALVGEVAADGSLEIVGIGTHPSRGLKKGVVVNIESTVQSIQRAIEEAQLMAGCRIHSAFVGVAGSHIRSLNSHGIVAIRDREVSSADLERVLDAAQAVAIPADQRVLHTLPQDYVIDNQEGVREPLGMSGVRLEAKVHVVTCAVNAAQNIEKCVRRCGLEVDDIILEQLASAYSVLTDDEKELGVCLVDIGGGTTDIAIFTEGAIRHTAVIPIAGDQVTNDIAMALRTPTQYAEEIKIRYACALAKLAGAGETIKVPSVGDRPPRELSRQALAEVVEPRYDELFTLIQAELRRSGYEDLIPAGIVLTGGTAKMEGAVELAEEIFHMPVRLGVPHSVKGLADVVRNPIYSTGVGLLMYGLQKQSDGISLSGMVGNSSYSDETKAPVLERIKRWVQGNF